MNLQEETIKGPQFMKTQLMRFLGLGLLGASLVGCTSINSGNLGHDVKPLPYKNGEEATIVKRTSRVDLNTGKMTTVTEEVAESGLAVNKQIQLKKLETARDVGVARAVSGSGGTATRGFWGSLLGGPANYYGANGGTYYGRGYGDNSAGGINVLGGVGGPNGAAAYNNGTGGVNVLGGVGGGIQRGYDNTSGGVNVITR